MRTMGSVAALSIAAAGLIATGSSADAATLTPHVQVSGRIWCGPGTAPPLPGPGYLAKRARFQAANGEAADARISGMINYSVDFNRVPAAGETVNVYVTCGGMGRQYGKSLRLTRQANQRLQVNISG